MRHHQVLDLINPDGYLSPRYGGAAGFSWDKLQVWFIDASGH